MKLLKLAGEGTLLVGVIALSGPGLGIAAQRYLFGKQARSKHDRRSYQQRVSQTARRLEQRLLVRLVDTPDGTKMEITELGRHVLKKKQLDDDVRVRERPWDGRWRIVLFDIPETKRAGRDALRELLRGVGFFQMQKSVLVTPYPCEKAVTQTAEYFEITDYVTCAEATRLGRQENEARQFFGLPPR